MPLTIEEHAGGGRTLSAPTMTELIDETVKYQLNLRNADATYKQDTTLYNTTLACDNSEFDLDIGRDLFLNQSRWTHLVREYLSRDNWARFAGQASMIVDGDVNPGSAASMLFRDPPRSSQKHFWGGCLMSCTFHGDNNHAGKMTFTMYSRTTYMGYMGIMDAALASVMIRTLKEHHVGSGRHFDHGSDIQFKWHISSMQLNCMKTLPYIYAKPELMARLERYERKRKLIENASPAWKQLATWFCRVADDFKKHDEDPDKFIKAERFGPVKRVKRRWLEHKGILKENVPESLRVRKLNLDKMAKTL
jgi:hypothetical protein